MIKTYRELDESDKRRFINYCALEKTDDIARANLRDLIGIINDPKERYRDGNGELFVLFEDSKIIGCSGVYLADFCQQVALCGTRSWLSKAYRCKQIIRNQFLPLQREWAISRGATVFALTFNDYNFNLRRFVERRVRVPTDPRTERMMFFKNMHLLDYQVVVKNTLQWVAYEKFTDWDFDWESIRHAPQED